MRLIGNHYADDKGHLVTKSRPRGKNPPKDVVKYWCKTCRTFAYRKVET